MKNRVIDPLPLQGWLQLGQAWVDQCLQVQRMQWELWGAWQRSLGATNQELWDEWACRWAGGAPIDA